MSQAQEPSASQHQTVPQPTDEPKVLGGGNMDPTNPLAGLENPEAEAKATEMGATIPSQGPPPELAEETETSGGSEESGGSQQQAGEGETVQENVGAGSQQPPSS
ncbi:hypothetical protein PLESTB_001561400 [Pleodorina starrii]|uniref:Uncharacterized protein n=1 Tax=Pleodorina starrii TaxID=330485 RepID=A0A9W6BY43_9CHLO|nr:hypothetical protein PLESTM_001477600 [Pleodorina starrii]GLC59990.1 hypothetical protein PLESTB_001561400 [Pleodorina starrii]GLC72782.1 hypothetical protein PLESTF_001292600 [Pleodorina starrii]